MFFALLHFGSDTISSLPLSFFLLLFLSLSLLGTDSTVAPALQAAQTELQKAQLEDKLEGRLERRPDREDLERRGIVSGIVSVAAKRRNGRPHYSSLLFRSLSLILSDLSFFSLSPLIPIPSFSSKTRTSHRHCKAS